MKQAIREFIQTQLLHEPEQPIDAQAPLLTTGILDSLGVMRLIAFLEERCHLQIPPEDVTLENFQTIQSITDYVNGHHG